MVTGQTTDYACFIPLLGKIAAAQDILRAHARGPLHRKKPRTGIVLADAGYLCQANLTLPGPGPADRHRQPPPPGQGRRAG